MAFEATMPSWESAGACSITTEWVATLTAALDEAAATVSIFFGAIGVRFCLEDAEADIVDSAWPLADVVAAELSTGIRTLGG